jgi:hypothetical protein
MTAPLTLPQFGRGPLRYHARALAELRRITQTPGYQPGGYPLPDEANADMPANALIEIKLSLPVGSYIYGFTGASQRIEGFEVQIVDLRHNAPFFRAPVLWNNITAQGSTQGITHPLFLLPHPRLVIEPAVLTVQIKNLSASSNQVQLLILTAEPRP